MTFARVVPHSDGAAAADLTAALAAGDLRYTIAARYPLDRIAEAHAAASRIGGAGRFVLDLWEALA
jgi:NADPH:quinone reductase